MEIGFCGSDKTMSKLATAFVLFLLVLETPVPSSARFMVMDLSAVTPRRSVSESTTPAVKKTWAADLMSIHHVNSSFAESTTNLSERVAIAVKSSQQRAVSLGSKAAGNQSTAATVYTSPVASGQGSYIMQITIGTPASTYSAIADTGSDLVWVQCTPCSTCFTQPDALFDPTTSSSYANASCTDTLCEALPASANSPCSSTDSCLYDYAYGDQSTTQGDFATETLTLTSTDGTDDTFPDFGFGCGTDNQGTFSGVDGLVGLGQGELSLVSQLGTTIDNVFSYCLVDFYSATTKTSPLLLGSVGSIALEYTPLVTSTANPSFYYVTVNGITVSGAALDYPSDTFTIDDQGQGGLIFDSGTTITQLATAAYNPLVDALSSAISYPTVDETHQGFDLCYDLSNVDSPTFPTVVFQLENVDMTLPDDNLFLQIDNAGTYCLAFQGTDGGISIFGNVQQQNFQISYDTANAQIGIAATTC